MLPRVMQSPKSMVKTLRENNQIEIKGILFYYQAQSTEAQNTVVDALPDPFI